MSWSLSSLGDLRVSVVKPGSYALRDLRVSVVKRRGQTLILALAIMFLLILIGGAFILMIVRNMNRVSKSGERDDSLALALAGLQFAADQIRTSPDGLDWRPRPSETLWRSPAAPGNVAVPYNPLPVPPYASPLHPSDTNGDGQFDANELRQMDPDHEWLSDSDRFFRPYVRFPSGGGRFLLRVTYLPQFHASSGTVEAGGNVDSFDPSSGMVHIECIGRPGQFDASDPTFYRGTRPRAAPDQDEPMEIGPYRKVEAFVPVGLIDQLWWVTNVTNEAGPADIGVPPYKDGNNQLVEYPTILEGGFRSNVDVLMHGRTVIRIYPARGEGVFVKGQVRWAPRQQGALGYDSSRAQNAFVQAQDDSGDPPNATVQIPKDDVNDNPFDNNLLAEVPFGPSGGGFSSLNLTNAGGETKAFIQDEDFVRGNAAQTSQSTRTYPAPALLQVDPVTGINRWHELTRDSGEVIRIDDNPRAPGVQTRLVNTGWYGLTSITAGSGAPANWAAKGLYIDNWGDIQYPNDRPAVKDEWLQRGSSDVRRRGWIGDYYVPSVSEGPTLHPITEVHFAQGDSGPVIRVTRFDMDQRQLNIQPDVGKNRVFYDITAVGGGVATLSPVGQSRDFDYPRNGVMYCEGSIRVHGVLAPGKQLTVVSGGTIYIEGNLVKPRLTVGPNTVADPTSCVALLAHDYVTLNPTVFTRIKPGEDVIVEADTFGPNGEPTNYHFKVQPGSDLDFTFSAAELLEPYTTAGAFVPMARGMLHLKHTAEQSDVLSETGIALYHPTPSSGIAPGWPFQGNFQYDWGTWKPGPNPPLPGIWSAVPSGQYLFEQWSAGQDRTNYSLSNRQTVLGSPAANYERKTFWLPTMAGGGGAGTPTPVTPGDDGTFRMLVGYKNGQMQPNAQPYWVSRIAVLPGPQVPSGSAYPDLTQPAQPLAVKIEAVMYAYTGSWFVIPPPYFNDNPLDTRNNYNLSGQRADGTIPFTPPTGGDTHPFYREPLNIDVEIVGAVSENMPAEPQEKARWTSQTWAHFGPPLWPVTASYQPDVFPGFYPDGSVTRPRPTFAPNIRYRFDPMLRRLVRVRNIRTGAEILAWAAPGTPPGTLQTVQQVISGITAPLPTGSDSYAETLPILPRLPAGAVIYEGNTL